METVKKIQCFYFKLRKHKIWQNDVRTIFDSNRKITLNPKTILNDLKKYYQSLHRDRDYNLSHELCSDLLDNNSILTLMDNLRCYVKECSCSWNATMGYKNSPMVVKFLVTVAFLLLQMFLGFIRSTAYRFLKFFLVLEDGALSKYKGRRSLS